VPCKASLEELVRTIESVARGEVLVTPRVAAALFQRVATLAAGSEEPKPGLAHLSRRKREILWLIDEGLEFERSRPALDLAPDCEESRPQHRLRSSG
jgi:DNA-binding NarL/FixJ family response regulator